MFDGIFLGVLTLTLYMYILCACLLRCFFVKFGVAIGGFSSETKEPKFKNGVYLQQIIVNITQFGQDWVLFYQKWYTDGCVIGPKIHIKKVKYLRFWQAHPPTILAEVKLPQTLWGIFSVRIESESCTLQLVHIEIYRNTSRDYSTFRRMSAAKWVHFHGSRFLKITFPSNLSDALFPSCKLLDALFPSEVLMWQISVQSAVIVHGLVLCCCVS